MTFCQNKWIVSFRFYAPDSRIFRAFVCNPRSPADIYYMQKPKGGILLPDTGFLQVYAYTSNARIPLEGVAVSVTASDGTAIAMRLTDRNGKITPVEIPVPELSAGQTPDTGLTPFTPVTLHARLKGYEQISALNIQIFPDTTTDQDLQMIPLSEFPNRWDQSESFETPPQNL